MHSIILPVFCILQHTRRRMWQHVHLTTSHGCAFATFLACTLHFNQGNHHLSFPSQPSKYCFAYVAVTTRPTETNPSNSKAHIMSVGVGLVDDDFGMELLVGGAIISLSLPVRLVWECVWRPTLPSAGSETSGECHNHLCPSVCSSAG